MKEIIRPRKRFLENLGAYSSQPAFVFSSIDGNKGLPLCVIHIYQTEATLYFIFVLYFLRTIKSTEYTISISATQQHDDVSVKARRCHCEGFGKACKYHTVRLSIFHANGS